MNQVFPSKFQLVIAMWCLFILPLFAQEDFRKNAPEPGPAPRIELGDYESFQLDNGLTVIVVENRKLPRVSFQLFVDKPLTGEGELTGLSSFLGQLLSRGTTKRTKAELDEAIDFVGASFSTSGSGMFGSALSKHQNELLDVMTEVLYTPAFPAEELEKLKTQTRSALAQAKEDPNAIAGKVADVLRFGKDHPYGELVTEATIDNITLDQIKEHYATFFKPNISYLVVVGDINAKEARRLAQGRFGKWERGEVPVNRYQQPRAPERTTVDLVDKEESVQSVITITYPVESRPGQPDAIPASVMVNMLGGFFGSRINKNIREDKGYSYGVGARLTTDPYVGYFTTGGSVRNTVTDSTIHEFLYEMNRIRQSAPDQTELDLVKNVMTGRFARSLESPQTIARFALNTARYDLPKDYYANYLKRLNAVTPAEVLSMAKKYIRPDQAHILVVGNAEEVASDLTRFATSGQVDYYDVYGNPIRPADPTDLEGITPQEVLERYFKAIGGKEKTKAVRDLTYRGVANTMMGDLEVTIYQKRPDKLASTITVNGMKIMEQKFDGKHLSVVQMGQPTATDPAQTEDARRQALIFPEYEYLQDKSVRLQLMGIENVNGSTAYKVKVIPTAGNPRTLYFDQQSGLKIRESIVSGQGDQKSTTVTDFKDYREVSGLLFPFETSASGGALPMTLTVKMKEVKVNDQLDDALFNTK